MFTGLVADLGVVTAVDSTHDGVRLNVKTSLAGELSEGDSVIGMVVVKRDATKVPADSAFTQSALERN